MENRRKFLRNVTLTSLGVGVIPAIAKGSQNNSLLSVPPPPPCNPTTSDYYGEGPFYTPDAPFIGDDNFIAITKYNISHFYAMAVYYLSEELKI